MTASHKPTIKVMNKLEMWEIKEYKILDLTIQRVIGGFVYSYPSKGYGVFVSTDELKNE